MAVKSVVILSGGVDSTVALHYVAKTLGYRPAALSFNYGQRHTKELRCASWQAQEVSAKHTLVDLNAVQALATMGHSSLVDEKVEVPNILEVMGDPQPSTYVPNRNAIMLMVAAGFAEALGAEYVVYGAQKHDLYGYWDTTSRFVDAVNAVLIQNRKNVIQVIAPLVHLSKAEVVRTGLELGVNFGVTWSCYNGRAKACGNCPTCAERLAAFADNGIRDPIDYE